MEPVPTSFHLGPFVFHTYGLGLAIAMYVGYRYGQHRMEKNHIPAERFGVFTIWMIVVALVGARLAHVFTNWSIYSHDPLRIFQVWEGGLASFGALALAIPIGWFLARAWWPNTSKLLLADTFIPALVLAWAVGRFLGPQFMVAGGGHLTHQWFGLRYAGQVGKRVPVPIIQGIEDLLLFGLLLFIEKKTTNKGPGIITGVALIIWGVVRSLDERLLLGQGGSSGSIGVQIAGLVLAAMGVVILVRVTQRSKSTVSN